MIRFTPLVRCPGPGKGIGCTSGALVEPGKRCAECRATGKAKPAKQRRRAAGAKQDGPEGRSA